MKNHPSTEGLPEHFKNISLLSLTALTAIGVYLVRAQIFVFGSRAGNWIYPYSNCPAPIPLWLPFTVLPLLILWVIFGSRLITRHELPALAASFCCALAIQLLTHAIYPIPIGAIVTSDRANSFYTPALRHTFIEILSRFPDLVSTFPLHASTNMPGKIILYQFLLLFTGSHRGLAWLIIAISTLGGILLYLICKQLFHDRSVAFAAFVLYSLIPGKLVFFPILNVVTPLFILAAFYCLLRYLADKNGLWLILLGVAVYATIFFDPTPLTVGFIFLAFPFHALADGHLTRRQFRAVFCLPIAAFLVTHILMKTVFSFDVFQSFFIVLQDSIAFNARVNRGYRVWILENLKEFLFAAGIPVSAVFLCQSVAALFPFIRDRQRWKRIPPNHLLTLSTLLTILVVALIGINRGEVTRLWIYLAVFLQIPAAVFLARSLGSAKKPVYLLWFALLLLVQSITALQCVLFVQV